MPAAPQHVLTVNLEDYFQVGAFNRYVQKGQWTRFESRLAHHVSLTLDLLDKHKAKATFFTLGWTAEKYPDVLKAVVSRGHEVASRGYYHRGVATLTPDELRADLAAARTAIERATGQRVAGYRVADGWLRPDDLWVLDVLAEEGYAYDSSVCPIGYRYRGDRGKRFAHAHRTGGHLLWEFPLSTARFLGFDLPIAGGNWVRQMPGWVMRRLVKRWSKVHESPLVMYFHTWELDPAQPRFTSAGMLTRVRHYRNLKTMSARVEDYLGRYRFVGIGDFLKLARVPAAAEPDGGTTPLPTRPDPFAVQQPSSASGITSSSGQLTPRPGKPGVTVVVPLFNEELIVPYLLNTLDEVRTALNPRYDLRFLLVDDGSTDQTWDAITKAFAARPDVKLVRHEFNQGVSAAIMTGIRNAGTEIVCSMDADCSYDPVELLNMIPKLTAGVAMVTASPYHPDGQVRNVPGWRLGLSKSASFLYRRVLRTKLHTYTSCFRVYRKWVATTFPLVHGNFLGIAELLGRVDIAGGTIVEHPAVLEVRMMGRSKMKTARTILGHVGLLARLAGLRVKEWVYPSPPLEHRNKTIRTIIAAASKPDTRVPRPETATPPPAQTASR
jgi:polysaccharide deacetylase family protein (PEP-CTERM system associated)